MQLAMLKEDMWCFPPIIGFGLAEPPKYYLERHSYFPRVMQTIEAARSHAHAFPRLRAGKYVGVVSAPLETTNFEPDLVMIYCAPSQLRLLVKARSCGDGQGIVCKLTASAACVWVPAIQNQECQVALPCPGVQSRAAAQDDELIFAIPKGRLEDVVSRL